MELPLVVFEPRYRQLTQECLARGEPFGVLLLKEGREAGAQGTLPYEVGTTAHIDRVETLADGRLHVRATGQQRFRVVSYDHSHPYLAAQVRFLPQDESASATTALVGQVKDASVRHVQALAALRGGYLRDVALPDVATVLSFLVPLLLQGQRTNQQRLLEMNSVMDRLNEELAMLQESYTHLKDEVERRWAQGTFSRN
jgi:Lon protease-like protein